MYADLRILVAPENAVCSPLAIALASLLVGASLNQDNAALQKLTDYCTSDMAVAISASV